MRERVIRKNQPVEGLSKQSDISNSFGLHQIKFAAALKRAEDLLNQPDMSGINDSLNCGKFNAKFLKEIKFIFKSFFGLNRN